MNSSEILNHPQRWKPVSRETALRECAFRTVVVVSKTQGLAAVSSFNRSSRYYQAGTRNLSGLQYFLFIEARHGNGSRPGGTGKTKSPPPKTAGSDSAAEAASEPEKVPPRLRLTKLDCECFAPLVDTVLIHYEITGDLDQAKAVHLRIASEKKPDKYILEKQLDGKPQAKGMFMWDGGVTDGDYAGCVNLIGSPYWVQLGLAVDGAAPKYANKVEIRVELMQTELIVGDSFGLGEDAKNADAVAALKEELKKTPGKGRIHMPGSFFKTIGSEMEDHHSYTVYGSELLNGVPIPLFVKLWLKGKEGGKKRSFQAVAGTRILWDTLPEEEASLDSNLADRGVQEPARKFVKNIALYKKDETEPPGATAQWELGGIRCAPPARKSRLQFESLLGDWDIKAPSQRRWAGFSQCAKANESMADSGMLYYNGRIAGDRYQVTAYVDLHSSLDQKNPKVEGIPAERKSQSLALQNWRDVNYCKSYVMGADTPSLGVEDANVEFKKAAISIFPKPGMFPVDMQAEWKRSYRNYLANPDLWPFIKDAAETDPGTYPVAFIPFEEYWGKSNPDVGFIGKVWHRIKAFFGAVNETEYIQKCDDAAYGIYTTVVQDFSLGEDGITTFKFPQAGDHNRQKGTYTVGIAPYIKGFSARNRAVLFVFSAGHATRTVIHEVGHHLFLPHAPGHFHPGETPAGTMPGLHAKDQTCIMSYNPQAEFFCAICLLRMGGWDHTYIRNNGAVIDNFKKEK